MCYEEMGRYVELSLLNYLMRALCPLLCGRGSSAPVLPRHDNVTMVNLCLSRLREAIECLRRALIGADPQETVIHLKLAKLHDELEEYAEAAAYHRRIVEVCRAARESPFRCSDPILLFGVILCDFLRAPVSS